MKRLLYHSLLEWKHSNRRKPLLLQGARQVGKTYLVNQFGQQEYSDFVYLNFEQNSKLSSLFATELKPTEIIKNLSLFLGRKIIAENTLLFFDEIQTAPNVLTSLKYFYEQSPEYHIIAAGSLLSVSIGKETSFPVGKVNFMTLFPMSFTEYLLAFGEESLSEEMATMSKEEALPEIIHEKLLTHLKLYFLLGGMPEVLNNYLQNHDIATVRQIQNEILESYKRDFSKYTDKNLAIKNSEVWRSIPYQLAKENKKFKYSEIAKNSRAATYEQSIEWLLKAGLIYVAYNISVPKLPLAGYADFTKFKIFLLDTGLLSAMLNIESSIILDNNTLFSEYNGAFTENFVASQLWLQNPNNLYYWTSNSDAEVDFIVQHNSEIYPVEVKSGLSRNKKSLLRYAEKFKPKLLFRFSPRNFICQDNFINIPLYHIQRFFSFV